MSELKPQSILIFLPDGSPRSVKIAEITNRVVKSVFFPRNKLEGVAKRDELANVGIYFLFGFDDKTSLPIAYIGEAEDCLKRIRQHNREKDFWSVGIVMVSKIGGFTKSHVKYLEHIAVQEAKEANRYILENTSIPSKPFVPEYMEADILDSFETIKILCSTLGYPIFEKVTKDSIEEDELFYLNGQGILAEGDYIDDGFIVFSGSTLKNDVVPSCPPYLANLRNKLIESEVIKENDEGQLTFIEDYVFGSPSTAGGFILGRATNGWKKWKNSKGKTLNEIHRS